MQIRLVAAELFQVDERADGATEKHDEANIRFSQFRERA
jgi:hypothetical protein